MKRIMALVALVLILLTGCATPKPPRARYVPGQPPKVVRWQDYEPGKKIQAEEYMKGMCIARLGRYPADPPTPGKPSHEEIAAARKIMPTVSPEDLQFPPPPKDQGTQDEQIAKIAEAAVRPYREQAAREKAQFDAYLKSKGLTPLPPVKRYIPPPTEMETQMESFQNRIGDLESQMDELR